MATTIYGASVYSKGSNDFNIAYDAFGKNSEVITQGDLLSTNNAANSSTGVLQVAANSTLVVGVAVKTATMASTNETVAKVSPGYIPVYNDTLFLMGTNADLTGNGTDAGKYFGITGATGVMQVDVATGVRKGTAAMVGIVEVDPFAEGGTGSGSGLRKCVVRILKTPYQNNWTLSGLI
jgi:hypothetical protein